MGPAWPSFVGCIENGGGKKRYVTEFVMIKKFQRDFNPL